MTPLVQNGPAAPAPSTPTRARERQRRDDPPTRTAKKIRAVPRMSMTFEVQGFFSMGNEVERVCVRVPTKREQDDALEDAHAYVAERALRTPTVMNDDEFMQDTKAAFIVAACCFEDTPDALPVWPTGQVVCEDLTPDQTGVMLRFVNEVRARFSPTPTELDDAKVEAFVKVAVAGSETDLPDVLLMALPQPYLVQLYILTALKVAGARKELEALQAPEAPQPPQGGLEADLGGGDTPEDESPAEPPPGPEEQP